jgi:hypothetical protein
MERDLELAKTLCEVLGRMMSKKNITRKAVSDGAGIPETSLYWKMRKGKLWVHELVAICRVIGVSVGAAFEIARTEMEKKEAGELL